MFSSDGSSAYASTALAHLSRMNSGGLPSGEFFAASCSACHCISLSRAARIRAFDAAFSSCLATSAFLALSIMPARTSSSMACW